MNYVILGVNVIAKLLITVIDTLSIEHLLRLQVSACRPDLRSNYKESSG